MKVRLAYGRHGTEWNIPDKWHTDIIEPGWTPGKPDQTQAVIDALKAPEGSPPLRELARTDSTVGIIFSDITRATPYNVIMPALLSELDHIPEKNITLFCATGTHRACTDEELAGILGRKIAGRYRIVQNIADDGSGFDDIGRTASGNSVLINRDLLACDLKILTGFIEPHFFMGFSGGGKAVMPGMASLDTIRFNHSIAMLENENARWGITEGNPVWEDMMETVGMVSGTFLLNVTMNTDKEITGVFAGDLAEAHEKGCRFAQETCMAPVEEEYDIVITSNSGYPLDLNVYQTVKGMSAAARIVRQGGVIITASECRDGIPPCSDYEKILTSASNIDELYGYIKQHEKNLQDTWQVFSQIVIQRKADVYLYSDRLDDTAIRRVLLRPVKDPESLIGELARKNGPGARICVLPEGPQTIPYVLQ